MFKKYFKRTIFTSSIKLKKAVAKNLKNKSVSSQNWLNRQLTDPYVEKAKILNYRCRSAFKLLEINEKYNILKAGQYVVDCGAAPGSWTQVLVNAVNSNGSNNDLPKGSVISVDKQQIFPIQGAVILGNSDFTTAETQSKIQSILNCEQADVVLSDMAPNATGIRELDNENMLTLCYSVLRFAVQISKVDASLIVKMWQCEERQKFQNDFERFYRNVKVIKPLSSRTDSAEIFILGREFKGLKSK